jgi:hypothetical protein
MATHKQGALGATDAIAGIELLDSDGNPLRLGSLWDDGPAVIVWLRHYG